MLEVLHSLKSGWSLRTLGPKEQVEGREGFYPWTGTAKPSGLALSLSLSLARCLFLSHSPLHPHFSCCLGKFTIPAALLNNTSVLKVLLLTTSPCQKQHARCVCLWKTPVPVVTCAHTPLQYLSRVVYLVLFHPHSHVQHFFVILL